LVDGLAIEEATPMALNRALLDALQDGSRRAWATPELKALAPLLRQCFESATSVESPERVRSDLRDAIRAIFEGGINRFFFILDDFDHVLARATPAALNGLAHFRVPFKEQLMFVTVTRKELALIRPEDEYQDFAELLTNRTVAVGALDLLDAVDMVNALLQKPGLSGRVDATGRDHAILLSGKHAGLLAAVLNAAEQDVSVNLSSPKAEQQLCGHVLIDDECAKLWQSLNEEEQQMLVLLASNEAVENPRSLQRKGLVTPNGRQFTSALFCDYVLRAALAAPAPPAVSFDAAAMTATADGQVLNVMDRVEFEMLKALWDSPGHSAAPQDLVLPLLRHRTSRHGGPTEQRFALHMADLIQKVNGWGRMRILLEGAGYRLVDSA
jgi:hypothetical protein